MGVNVGVNHSREIASRMIQTNEPIGLGTTSPFFTRECSTALKGIAIVLVIFGHRGLIDCAGSWGVLIFLMLSGYGIFKSVNKKGLAGYWCNRFVSVLAPYMLFSVFQLGLSFAMGRGGVDAGNVLCTLMGFDFGLNVDPTMWYISYIFACYAVFYVAWRFYQRSGATSFVLVLLASFILLAVVGLTNTVWHRGTASWVYFWAFPAGALLAMHEKRLAGKGATSAICVLVYLLALAAVLLLYGTQHGSLNLFVYSAAGATLVILTVMHLMSGPMSSVLTRVLRPVGDASYAMYLNEGFLIRLDVCAPFVMGPVLTLAFSFGFATVWSLIVSDRVSVWLKRRWQ